MSREPNLIDFIDHQLNKLAGNPDYTLMMQALMTARAAMTTKPCAEIKTGWPLGVAGGKQLMLNPIDNLPPEGTKLYAFDMPPVVTGENLDLLAAHREIADLKDQLAKSEAKFQNMLEAEHRLSDAYIRIREIVGTIRLPEGADVWQATEAAAAKLVAMTGQPVKQPQTHDAHGFPEPAHILNSRWIEAIRAAGHEVQE